MKLTAFRWLAPIILLATLSAAGPASPPATTTAFSFNVGSTYGDREEFNFRVTEGGCILAQIASWSRSGTTGRAAEELALIINGPGSTRAYARNDGAPSSSVLPLWTSYSIPSGTVSRAGTWTVSVVNFMGKGAAKGKIDIEYPQTRLPCELKATVSRTRGRIDLSWRYTGTSFGGSFLIERSTNGRTWSGVRACAKRSLRSTISYSCSDTRLRSGSTYYYRACAITSGSRCRMTNLTPPVRVRAP